MRNPPQGIAGFYRIATALATAVCTLRCTWFAYRVALIATLAYL